MFTQPCFIRKISHELCDKLTELGYKDCWTDGIHSEELKTITYIGNQCWCLTGFEPKNSIDCGTNEELFLALAALRDDTDKNQWIIDEANECFGLEDSMMICDRDDMNDRAVYTHYRKATVEEIIEHFKSK